MVRGMVALGIMLLVWIGGAMVPMHEESVTRGCGVCGIGERSETLRVAGREVRRRVTPVEMGNEARYEVLVGVPHAHNWQVIGVSSRHGSIWGWSSVGCGGAEWSGVVGRESLDFLEMNCGRLPRGERQAIHARLIGTKSPEEFQKISGAVADKVWPRR
jgi:hypothetical protein